MTKTICDICGKEMSDTEDKYITDNINFCISSNGKLWDICIKCRIDFSNWITTRKVERRQ